MSLATTEAVKPGTRKAQQIKQDLLRSRVRQQAGISAHDYQLSRLAIPGESERTIPSTLTLVRHPQNGAGNDQLFLDHLPVPREDWSYDDADSQLIWRTWFGGGHLRLTPGHDGLSGNIGSAEDFCSVQGRFTARYVLSVAADVGAAWVSDGRADTGITWDPAAGAWTAAQWQQQRLELTYVVAPGGPMQPADIEEFVFRDLVSKTDPWRPETGTYGKGLALGTRAGAQVWNLEFKSLIDPPSDGDGVSTDSVMPYWLEIVEDLAAQHVDGAISVGPAGVGPLLGVQGQQANPAIAGYYRTAPAAAPFRVFQGRLHVADSVVPHSHVDGDTLTWAGLSQADQQLSGLTAAGTLTFTPDGAAASTDGATPTVARLDSAAARAAITDHAGAHPLLAAVAVEAEQSGDSPLTITGLTAMNPYLQGDKGWYDSVQADVTNGLQTIMNSQIPDDLWNLVLSGQAKPTLQGELATIYATPVPKNPNPQSWYGTLATAVMTQGLANGSDPNCANLNGPRAAQWIKSQVSTSPVYYTHGQALYQYQWQQHFPLTSQYLADQNANATTYPAAIDAQTTAALADLEHNVKGIDAKTRQTLHDDIVGAGSYAKDQGLYWAFYFFTYNTSAGVLAGLSFAISGIGAADPTAVSRLLQTNISVLTALDPSGFFAKRYTATVNAFLATSALTSLYGFTDDGAGADLIREYLEQLVSQNLNSEVKAIADAAAGIKSVLDSQAADEMLTNSIAALRELASGISDAIALPYVAQRFVPWFEQNYPNLAKAAPFLSTAIVGGLAGMAIMNLITAFKSWKSLSPEQRGQIIVQAAQLGTQLLVAVVVRGVRIYAMFGVEGLTAAQRVAAISRIAVVGDAADLDVGLLRISNGLARYIGNTAGTSGRTGVMSDGAMSAVLVGDEEQVTFLAAVMGKNLTEFVGTTVGALFVLAGMALSIWNIVDGDTDLALASDIINLVSGALMLFSTVGGFFVTAGVIEAESVLAGFIAAAGPLALILALVGIGIALYLAFKKPPDPVAEFVTDYASPAGLAVPSKASAIDYVLEYERSSDRLLMCGAQLQWETIDALTVADNGALSLAPPTSQPSDVFTLATDGLGLTTVGTVIRPDPAKGPVAAYLSLMSDNTLCFQSLPAGGTSGTGQPTVTTVTWLFEADTATVDDSGNLVSMPVLVRPVLPDASGKFTPSGVSPNFITVDGTTVGVGPAAASFTLTMSGIAPNYMVMNDVAFKLGSKPSTGQVFAPRFGVRPSPPTFTSTGTLPAFLTFSTTDGSYRPNGTATGTVASSTPLTVGATNALGTASASFAATVE